MNVNKMCIIERDPSSHYRRFQGKMVDKLRSSQWTDAVLACPDGEIACHKIIIGAACPYFENLVDENIAIHASISASSTVSNQTVNPVPDLIVFMKDLKFWQLKAVVEYIYEGSIFIEQVRSDELLEVFKKLQLTPDLGSSSSTLVSMPHLAVELPTPRARVSKPLPVLRIKPWVGSSTIEDVSNILKSVTKKKVVRRSERLQSKWESSWKSAEG